MLENEIYQNTYETCRISTTGLSETVSVSATQYYVPEHIVCMAFYIGLKLVNVRF